MPNKRVAGSQCLIQKRMVMEIMLPPRKNGTREKVIVADNSLVIIGANGAGKTRFTDWLMSEIPVGVYRISALNALYLKHEVDNLPGSIDSLYEEAVSKAAFLRDDIVSQFDRMMVIMIYYEMLNLINHKMAGSEDNTRHAVSESLLDKMISAWLEIFPDNKVKRARGEVLFARKDNEEKTYSSFKLSDGERAVLYYFGSVLLAPENGIVFVDTPGLFLHPSITGIIWDKIEQLRPDCSFIYTTHDIDFLSSRHNAKVVWVRKFYFESKRWDYAVLPLDAEISDDMYMTLVGARKPMLFIEGDAKHSIDAKLYPLVFRDYTVKSLGGCDKVIEATRTFNDLNSLHHLLSRGIVDRDRRSPQEVGYLRGRNIYVPEVAEIENILMLEEVIRTVASVHGKNEHKVFDSVRKSIIGQFRTDLHKQALLHTRHRVKRLTECRIDGKFPNITALETHLQNLVNEIRPRQLYEKFCREFKSYIYQGDYSSILRVYNQKSMIPSSNVAGLCGLSNKEAYVQAIINILRHNGDPAARIRKAIIDCFGINDERLDAPKPEISLIKND